MLRIGIYIFDQVEVLDFAGPFEVFTTATRVFLKHEKGTNAPFEVVTIARTKAAIRARAGLVIAPDFTIDNHPKLDALLIPGGVVDEELKSQALCEWIQTVVPTTKLSASICTGAFLLARAGLLEGKKATTHWEDIDDLKAMFPNTNVVENVRWVDEGHIVTSAGISAGIDMSLHLVRRLVDNDLAEKTARQLEFDWTQNG
ncbi:DJ-1/PfpI family protein [Sulfurospirillum cavolei]|uniref:DJ-1/PfpI family protein n=1 Tax=Sulfurospirillum cavolei TaxID=366522 RepID=UPI0005A7C282|nr:DJ-1/PfpI family protein [Sulfurospirillum cavolei]